MTDKKEPTPLFPFDKIQSELSTDEKQKVKAKLVEAAAAKAAK